MGNMKELYSAMDELGAQLQEFDPTSFEDAKRLVEMMMGPIERREDTE